ncbi:MFS general substrate transporter [Auricularia subglabra TFB-10046 SS5]|nr:MFS general substrate transporter [Auricularia subglabra TFB-10046 SS5]
MYFIPYCLCECPANLVLKKLRPSRWLPGITVLWGIVRTTMGLVHNYPQLVVVRICLAIAEGGLFPGVIYYLTLWYPRHMCAQRIGIFYSATSLAGAFSGLLAYGISFMSGVAGRLGWSWIFILEGMFTAVAGFCAFFLVPDFPDTAKFLNADEKAYVIWKKKYDNSSVGEAENFKARYIWKAVTDWQLYPHILVNMSIVAPLYGISLFLPSIINGFGYSPAITQLLTVPPYVFGTIVIVTFAYYSDQLKLRAPFILAGHCMCVLGFAINISDAPRGVKYFGTFFCVAGSYGAYPPLVSWLGNNSAGQYKRGISLGAQIGMGNFAGAIASNIFRSQDAPRYILGHGIVLMFVGIGMSTVCFLALTYTRINRARDERAEKGDCAPLTAEEIRELGDRAPDFRYTL